MDISIYIINFNLVWTELYPPLLRLTRHLEWGYVLSKPMQYLRNLIFEDYANGSPYSAYSGASSYVEGDRVFYTDRAVYELSSATASGISPTSSTDWTLINDNYIGIRERIKYNSQKILFEWGLNRWFMCSGIYIENTPIYYSGFLMGQTGFYSSAMSNSSAISAGPAYMMNSLTIGPDYSYIIWVPIAVFTSLGTTTLERENIIRSFADKYNLAGMIYSVQTY